MNTHIAIVGCDDTTRFDMETTAEERAFLERIAAMSVKASRYACQPEIKISDKRPCDEEDDL